MASRLARDLRVRCETLAAFKCERVDFRPGLHIALDAVLTRGGVIGGSSAGVYIDNRPMVASLYRGIPKERFGEIHSLFLRLGEEFGVPFEVVNDGEVTALAGSM